jgi:hypothetical protein
MNVVFKFLVIRSPDFELQSILCVIAGTLTHIRIQFYGNIAQYIETFISRINTISL